MLLGGTLLQEAPDARPPQYLLPARHYDDGERRHILRNHAPRADDRKSPDSDSPEDCRVCIQYCPFLDDNRPRRMRIWRSFIFEQTPGLDGDIPSDTHVITDRNGLL